MDSLSIVDYDWDTVYSIDTGDSTATDITLDSKSIMTIPKAYDFHALGMFCKFDVYLDKGSKIPLRFRLGTVGGVDELERKLSLIHI